jgi:ketosteroid isomerase-like protein
MSQENVEIYTRGLDAWTRGDFDAAFESYDPDVVLRLDAETWVESGVILGAEPAREWFKSLASAVGHDTKIVSITDASDRVVARVCTHVRGQSSGVEGDMEVTQVVTYRNDNAVLVEFFGNHAEALEAVGLSEQT